MGIQMQKSHQDTSKTSMCSMLGAKITGGSECTGTLREALKHDVSGKGFLTKAEFSEFVQNSGIGCDAAELFDQFDFDKNGCLDKQELEAVCNWLATDAAYQYV